MKNERDQRRPLLCTTTREPFQPVRLYYALGTRGAVEHRLRTLECMVWAPPERCWQWLYCDEAASLRFSMGGYGDVPMEKRPIVLGRLRFPAKGGMIFETNSTDRAVAGARFFASLLGADVVALRCRIVNQFFEGHEGVQQAKLMKILEQNVEVVDWRAAEVSFKQRFRGVRDPQSFEQAAARDIQQRLESKEDVPLVEDFPLTPEEETPDFKHLATTLQFRVVRAFEHWRGNTDLTLTAIIVRAVEQSMGGRESCGVTLH